MIIHFHGAAQTVTGSQHLLEINGYRLLLDCGLFQGKRKLSYERNLNFRFDPTKLDAVLLSHAHIDHIGNLPNLVKNGYSGPVYATTPTVALVDYLLRDSAKIQESDIGFVNKKRLQKGKDPVEPLYTTEDAVQAINLLQPKQYNQIFEPVPGVTVEFVEAGHILGSAAIVLDIEEKGRKFRLWFSGDVGRKNKPLIRDPEMPKEVDFMLLECTYGHKEHRDPMQSYDELRDVVNRTIHRNGKIIIPAFAVGRTQELVYFLNQMIQAREIPRVPVYVDSPLAVNVTDVFKKFAHIFDEETHDFIEMGDQHREALGFDLLTYVRSVEESKALNDRRDPMIIISASGMAEAGRILHHLRHNIEDPRNTVLIVSWQAPYTLGRRLAEQEKKVKIFGEKFKRRCEVVTIGGFSAHAGQTMLREYVGATKDTLQKVFLVHGEKEGALALQEKLHKDGIEEVHYPELHSSWVV